MARQVIMLRVEEKSRPDLQDVGKYVALLQAVITLRLTFIIVTLAPVPRVDWPVAGPGPVDTSAVLSVTTMSRSRWSRAASQQDHGRTRVLSTWSPLNPAPHVPHRSVWHVWEVMTPVCGRVTAPSQPHVADCVADSSAAVTTCVPGSVTRWGELLMTPVQAQTARNVSWNAASPDRRVVTTSAPLASVIQGPVPTVNTLSKWNVTVDWQTSLSSVLSICQPMMRPGTVCCAVETNVPSWCHVATDASSNAIVVSAQTPRSARRRSSYIASASGEKKNLNVTKLLAWM